MCLHSKASLGIDFTSNSDVDVTRPRAQPGHDRDPPAGPLLQVLRPLYYYYYYYLLLLLLVLLSSVVLLLC